MSLDRTPCKVVDASSLGDPLNFVFSNRSAGNRFLKAAMTEHLSSWDPKDLNKRGIPTQNMINVYTRWGEGSIGTILTGNTMIALDQLEAAGNAVIPPDSPFSGERFEAFKNIAAQAKKHGSLIISQVSHPGRQTPETLQINPVSASNIELDTKMGVKFAKPHAASMAEIQHIIYSFTYAAQYLYKAGFDGIQLHGAHGYLLAQFISPTSNKRTDAYGGNFANRARLTVDIARSIRKRIPASTGFILGIKLNSVEWQEGGFSGGECRELCALLENEGFDFIELSGGTYERMAFEHRSESSKQREAFFMDFADSIVPVLKKTKIFVTGGFRTAAAMVRAVETIDGIGLGRPLCQEFDFCEKILNGSVASAIDIKFDESNFGLANLVAGSQIRQVGKGEEPIDMSVEKNVESFMKDVAVWLEIKEKDAGAGNHFGYIDLTPTLLA